jgi:membrane fusion protein, multidrug efflux system
VHSRRPLFRSLTRLLAGVSVTLLLIACSEEAASPQRAGGPPGAMRGPTLVVAELAAMRVIRDEVEAVGTARANESVTIAAKVTDTISRVRFDDGDLVESGQVLVELTNREETALLAEAQANVDDARRQLDRLEDLLKQRTVPVSQVDEARARFAAADARYQSVVARLADRLIRAPFGGVLGFRRVSEGALITPGTPIVTLDDLSIIKLDFSLPETYLGLVQPGMELAARSAAFPERVFPATVRTIESRVDPVTRAASIRAHIDNDGLLLRPGMLLTLRLVTAERLALMVPEDALVKRSSETFVYVVEEDTAQMRAVSHGARSDGWVEILAGLTVGDAVITEGVIKVRPGAPVRVQQARATEPEAAPVSARRDQRAIEPG